MATTTTTTTSTGGLIPAGYTVRAARDFGVMCDGVKDDTSALQSALNKLQSNQALQLPAGTCVISKHLALARKANVAVVGAGMDATVLQSKNPIDGSFEVQGGDTVRIGGFQVYYPTTSKRLTTFEQECFAVLLAAKNVTVDGVKGRNCPASGVIVGGANGVVVQNSYVDHSWADAYHVAYGSKNVTVKFNTANAPGDDMFSSIGYANTNSNISFTDNKGFNGKWGGGVSFESTNGGYAARNYISGAGVSCYRAANWGTWDKNPTQNIVIENNYGENCVTRTTSGHASLMAYTNAQSVTGVTFRNNTIVKPASGPGFRAFGQNGGVIQAAANTNAFSNLSKCFNIGTASTVSRSGNTLNGTGCS